MIWVILALIGALSNAAYFILIKKYITTRDPRVLTAMGFLFSGLILIAISGTRGFPALGPAWYSAVVISGILNIIGLSLIFRAMESSDLSLTMPMLSFTPVFLIGTSFLILHEVPSMAGIAGICIIVSGSYVLNISSEHERILDPVRSMIQNRGSWYMLIVAFLFAASVNYDKIAMLNSDPFLGIAFTLLIISTAFGIFSIFSGISAECDIRDGRDREPAFPGRLHGAGFSFRPYIIPAFLAGILVCAECVSINYAYTLQIAPYVIAIKRLSIIFMVLYGTVICAEDEIRTRILGSVLMVGGAVIILLFA